MPLPQTNTNTIIVSILKCEHTDYVDSLNSKQTDETCLPNQSPNPCLFSTGDPLLTFLRFDQPINAGLTKKYVVYHLS